MSDSLRPHGLRYTRLRCPSPTPGTYSNSCPLSWWCHPTISSSVIRFSSRLQLFPASGSFQMSQFFASGGQSIGVSASASVLMHNILSGLISFRIDWFDLLAVQGTLKNLLQHHNSKASTDSNLQSSGLWDLCIKSSHNCEREVSSVPFYRWGNLAEKDRASIWNYFWSGVVTACFIQSSKWPYEVDILERRKLRFWEMNYPEDL